MNVRTALILAAAILLVSFAARSLDVEPETARRIQGVIVGLTLTIFANAIPKKLPPLSGRKDPARAQAYQRFAGWTFALAGIGHALAWSLLPIEQANTAAMLVVGGGLVLVVATCIVAAARAQTPAR